MLVIVNKQVEVEMGNGQLNDIVAEYLAEVINYEWAYLSEEEKEFLTKTEAFFKGR